MFTDLAIWLYLISVVGNLTATLMVISLALIVLLLIACIFAFCEQPTDTPSILRNKYIYAFLVFSLIVGIIVPSNKTMYMILGLNMSQRTYELNQKDLDETAKLVLESLNKKLRESLSDDKK
jgi:hypothetical protein